MDLKKGAITYLETSFMEEESPGLGESILRANRSALVYLDEKAILFEVYSLRANIPFKVVGIDGYFKLPRIRKNMWKFVIKPELRRIADNSGCKLSTQRTRRSGVVTFRFK